MHTPLSHLAAVLVCSGICTSATAVDLTITAKGVASDKGKILVAVYSKAGDWLKTPAHVAEAAAVRPSTSLTVKGLVPGNYAVLVFQDENGNEDLDTNVLGIPTEPYGFSNDAMGAFGPPSFEKATVKVGSENLSINIQLH